MKDRTTLQVRKEILKAIKDKKKYRRETYEDILIRELKLDIKTLKIKGGYLK